MPSKDKLNELDDAVVKAIAPPNRTMAPVGWFGGKGNLVKRILPHIPWSKVYCEPYCGAASVFWHLKPRPVEVLNDLNGEIINLFRCIQNPETFAELRHRLIWTPYSRAEFCRALEVPSDAPLVERAWASFVKYNQGMNGMYQTSAGSWARKFISRRGMAECTNKWRGRFRLLTTWHDRLTRVQLDNRDALEVIRYWDSPETFFYIDPPYVSKTRKSKKVYANEPTEEHHRKLVSLLLTIQGGAAVSGYDHDIYHLLEDAGWRRYEFQTACYAAGRIRNSNLRGKGAALNHVPRTEILWVKPQKANGLLAL